MTIEQLRAVYQARPFRPFALHLADGEKLHVPRMDFLSHSPKGRMPIVDAEDDSISIVDLSLVTRLEIQDGAATTPGGDE